MSHSFCAEENGPRPPRPALNDDQGQTEHSQQESKPGPESAAIGSCGASRLRGCLTSPEHPKPHRKPPYTRGVFKCMGLAMVIRLALTPTGPLYNLGVDHKSDQRAGARSHAPAWEQGQTLCVPGKFSRGGRSYDQGHNLAYPRLCGRSRGY
jgi:hypothetical protein